MGENRESQPLIHKGRGGTFFQLHPPVNRASVLGLAVGVS